MPTADLINLFEHVQREGGDFIRYAEKWFRPKYNQPDAYLRTPRSFSTNAQQNASRQRSFLLEQTRLQWLCAVTISRAVLTKSFGRYKQLYFLAAEMRYFHEKASPGTLAVADFATRWRQHSRAMSRHCDPPYVPFVGDGKFHHVQYGWFWGRGAGRIGTNGKTTAFNAVSGRHLQSQHTAYTTRLCSGLT